MQKSEFRFLISFQIGACDKQKRIFWRPKILIINIWRRDLNATRIIELNDFILFCICI